MAYVVAIDGGGTKTVAAAAELTGRLAGLVRGAPTNPHDGGLARASDALVATVRALLAEGIAPGEVSVVYACFSGRPDFAPLLASLLPKADVRPVFEAAFCLASALEDRRGAVVLAGTGAFEWARGPAGEHRVDGLGMFLGDEGSAYWLVRQALIAAGRAYDGRGPATLLQERLFDTMRAAFFNIGTPDRHFVAGLAHHVTEAADEGDREAQAICRLAALHLARGTRVAARRAGLDGDFPIVLTGGLLRHGDAVTAPLVRRLGHLFPAATVTRPAAAPVLGGLCLALKAAGTAWTPALLAALDEAYRHLEAGLPTA